jgi:toluene monooxygenase electron transfer component
MTEVCITDRNGAVQRFLVAEGERVLHAGLAAGCALPHECATGTCGSCRATLDAGGARRLWGAAPGTRGFRKESDVLMCQITAQTDLALSLRGGFPDPATIRPITTAGVVSAPHLLTPEIARVHVALEHPITFLSGQFALVDIPGIEGPRAYSMIRAGGSTDMLSFLVRLTPDGAATRWLFGAGADRRVRVLGPLGKATYAPDDVAPFVAIVGGSGIAGLLSILDCAVGEGLLRDAPASLFFGLRAPGSAYLLDDLARTVQQAEGGLSATVVFSGAPADDETRARYPDLKFGAGFVHEVAAVSVGNVSADTRFYVAGPPGMVDAAMKSLVIEHKIQPARIRYDRFG